MARLLYDRLLLYLKGTEFAVMLDGATILQNHDALRAVWEDGTQIDELPSLAPVYPRMFVETRLPFFFKKEVYGGVLLEATECPDGDLPFPIAPLRLAEDARPRWVLAVLAFVDPKTYPHRVPFAESLIILDERGQSIPLATEQSGIVGLCATWLSEATNYYVQSVYAVAGDYIPPGTMEEFAEQLVDSALLTLGLLHIKNIETVDMEPNRQESRKFEKHYGQPLARYKVLKVTGKGGGAGTVIGGNGAHLPLHWCRAHFRTYTDAAPLFGRLTGTFYVPPHLRGSSAYGEVLKDYKVDRHV